MEIGVIYTFEYNESEILKIAFIEGAKTMTSVKSRFQKHYAAHTIFLTIGIIMKLLCQFVHMTIEERKL